MPELARTYLYVPADRAELPAKAARSAADALILDLEDAVAEGAKDRAREQVAQHLATADPARLWWVRVNAGSLAVDLEAAVARGLCGIVLPGAEPDLVAEADEIISDREARLGLRAGSVRVIGLLETARGVVECAEVARSPRVVRLGIGEADLAADLGMRPGLDRAELWPIRTAVVVHSAAQRLARPIGPVEQNVHDAAMLEESTALLLRQGFGARTAIHPGQVATIHRLLTPSAAEVATAQAVLELFEEAERAGRAVALAPDGQLIDPAVLRGARQILDLAGGHDQPSS